MTGRTHDLAAFTALTLVFINLPELPQISLATAIAAFGANFIGGLFPDIDQPTSDFWDNFRLGPFVAKVVCPALGGHRNISHSLLGIFLIGFGSKFVFWFIASILTLNIDPYIVWQAFMIGVISHIIMDLPTKAGVPLLWPFKWVFGIPPVKWLRITSGKFVENFIIFPGLLFWTGHMLYTHQDKVLLFVRQYIK